MPTLTPESRAEQLALAESEDYQRMLQSMRLLGDAMEALEQPVSSQMAAGIAATENAWLEIEAEFGLLDGRTVARLAGSKQTTGGFANDRRKARKILGIFRRNAYLYPGFQFTDSGMVYHSVLDVLREASQLEVSDEDVAQWFLLESPSLDGERPVDVIEDADQILAVFRGRFGAQW
ncbi:hypothetical protein GCM10009720_06300 [Yaniella flava]|uniref:Antitoxin Xre/MbcA/ParS-like toxin-binding domain-containing protein n=1 Tax=Yaniella flava TaxID=287930 RepID=A0ABP5FNG1_9MICC